MSLLRRAGATVLLLSLSGAALATDLYMTPDGAGDKKGGNFANALPRSSLSTVLNSTMKAGDTLYLGSGDYRNSTMSVTASGTSTSWKRVIGVDTGAGWPIFDSKNWTRMSTEEGQDSVISLGASYWSFENLVLRSCRFAVKKTSTTEQSGFTFRNIDITNVRHGFYLLHTNQATIEDCSVRGYSKHGFRLDRGCDNVVFSNCLADLTDGDPSWTHFAEVYPFGFIVNSGGAANTDVTFTGCIARNNRTNTQPDSYFNGDGFVVEGNTSGVQFQRCLSVNNEDGGYDIKAAATFTDCVSVRNYRGFRCWDTAKTITNCVATYPFRRSHGNLNGGESGDGIWIHNGTATVDRFTFHGHASRGVNEDDGGRGTLTNSILSFTGSGGLFTAGSITFGSSNASYRPGVGTNPNYLAPSPAWDGVGTAMNNSAYGAAKGYSFPGPGVPVLSSEPAFTLGTANTLTWSSVAGATGYEVQRLPAASHSSSFGSSGWITGTAHTFSALPDGVLQHYRVRARFGTSVGSWSSVIDSTQDASGPAIVVPAVVYTTRSTATVRGRTVDTAGTLSLTVNGAAAATSDSFAHWTATVTNLAPGANTITIVATDRMTPAYTTTATIQILRQPDGDGDLLPDAWETARGMNPADNGSTLPANGRAGDIDRDGILNLLEYALGHETLTTSQLGLPTARFERSPADGDTYFVLTYRRRLGALDFLDTVETTDNFLTWSAPGRIEPIYPNTANADGATETVKVRILPTPGAASQPILGARVRVTTSTP